MPFKHAITLDSIRLYPVRARGGVSPKMALGTMPSRPALLIRIDESNGCCGWGEVWANFPPRANQHKAHIIDDVIAPKLGGFVYTDPMEVDEALRSALSVYFLHVGQQQVFEHILAGINVALWDLSLRFAGLGFAEFMALEQAQARCYATSINAEDLERLIPTHVALGQRYFKLKIGFAEHGHRALVEKAIRLCPADARIMVDSNQSWSVEQAQIELQQLEDLALFFAEEPIPANAALTQWEKLAGSTTIPLAAGENIYGVEAFLSMANAGVRVLQPDVAKWGGVSGALTLAANMPEGTLLWPHFMGSAVGQMAALAVTSAIGDASVCEVDVNDNALRTELCGPVLNISQGCVSLPASAGLVSPPSSSELHRFSDADAQAHPTTL